MQPLFHLFVHLAFAHEVGLPFDQENRDSIFHAILLHFLSLTSLTQ